MTEFVRLVNAIDTVVALWRDGLIPFICLSDRLIALGCYAVTETSCVAHGITIPYRSL